MDISYMFNNYRAIYQLNIRVQCDKTIKIFKLQLLKKWWFITTMYK